MPQPIRALNSGLPYFPAGMLDYCFDNAFFGGYFPWVSCPWVIFESKLTYHLAAASLCVDTTGGKSLLELINVKYWLEKSLKSLVG